MIFSKKLSLTIFLVLFFSCLNSFAALRDDEGMPIVYLRGSFSNWAAIEKYKFQREGNLYKLEINWENAIEKSEFKIADEDWEEFDYGGASEGISLNETSEIILYFRGRNLITDGISKGVISFVYENEGNLKVDFLIHQEKDELTFSGSLPVMYINVYKDSSHTGLNNEIIDYNLSHKDYFNHAEYWIDINGCEWMQDLGGESIGSEAAPLPLQIKARGNWTRIGFSKKPFKIKLDKKQNLLGLTPEKSKHYALLAHADDNKGYLKNYVSFNLGERIGLPWTPGMQPVELVINGDYRGLYFLTESIRVGEGRILIEELEDNCSDGELVSGGYVVELDNYDEANQIRMEEKSFVKGQHLDALRITWDTPENYSDLQLRFIKDQFSVMNDLVGKCSDELWSYLDMDDLARYYLVQEIVSDTEAFHGSTYLFRNRGEGEKWHFSPLWDSGNAFNGRTDEFFYNCDPFGNTWIPSIRENRLFNDKLKDTWLWFMHYRFEGIEEDIDNFASHIQLAVKADRQRWKSVEIPSGGQAVADNSDMVSRIKEVKDHLNKKTEWLLSVMGDYSKGPFVEPERDKTPSAQLPDFAKASVDTIEISTQVNHKEYYNLQGLKVKNPKKGELYILKENGKTRKIVY